MCTFCLDLNLLGFAAAAQMEPDVFHNAILRDAGLQQNLRDASGNMGDDDKNES